MAQMHLQPKTYAGASRQDKRRIKRTEWHHGTGLIRGARAGKRGVGSVITEKLRIDIQHV